MATTTPNYGWPVPTSSDLVKNGATAIEALGDAADATMATMVAKAIVDAKGDIIAATAADTVSRLAVGANNTVLTADSSTATGLKWAAASSGALTLIARTSFSAVASQAFDSVFTSTYKSYLVVIDQIWAASGNAMQMQLRYAGPTTQASGYYGNNIYARANAATVTNDNTSNAAEFKINPTTGSSSLPSRGFFYISGVGNASETSDFNGMFNDGQNSYGGSFNGSASTARTYTGFLLKTASNITGTVSIYGLAAA